MNLQVEETELSTGDELSMGLWLPLVARQPSPAPQPCEQINVSRGWSWWLRTKDLDFGLCVLLASQLLQARAPVCPWV